MNSTYIDTHCHLNFKRFKKDFAEVIAKARSNGLGAFIIPGTDIPLSKKAAEMAGQFDDVYAAVGVHPHHTFDLKAVVPARLEEDMTELEKLLRLERVVAVGEVGLDAHVYEDTKYPEYRISAEFMQAQKEYLRSEIRLALRFGKALIIHNRETKNELMALLDEEWREEMRFRTVFHCCEPDRELLSYAISHDIFIGVDGDVTYGGEKAEFVKAVPLDRLVLETDSPFLLPEPLKTKRLYPNTPANIPLIADSVAQLKGIPVATVAAETTANAKRLFAL